MKLDSLGLNHFEVGSATCHTVTPLSSALSSGHLRAPPPHSASSRPLASAAEPLRNRIQVRREHAKLAHALVTLFRRHRDPVTGRSVLVVRGAPKHERRVYKFWEEPAPNVVLEISSRKTRKDDFGKKKDLYAWLGVREYFVFDPEPKLRTPLRVFRLHGTEFVEEIVTGYQIVSHELGLELVIDGHTLRLWNPRAHEYLSTPAEEALARQVETARAEREAARAEAEAARAARLAAKLRELGLDPDQL